MTTVASDAAALAAGILDAERLKHALSDVLEAMFFCPADEILVNPAPGDWALPEPEQSHSSCLHFRGPVSGDFGLACSRDLARSLAESFHGETPSSEEISAVLLEMSNIVCGNHLSQLDARAVFCLDSPRPLLDSEWSHFSAADRTASCTRLALRTEEGWIGAWIQIAA